jgi:hypothetical protein
LEYWSIGVLDYSLPYIALLSFTTCPLMPYACFLAFPNAFNCEMGDVDRRVLLAWQAGHVIDPFSSFSFLLQAFYEPCFFSFTSLHYSLAQTYS